MEHHIYCPTCGTLAATLTVAKERGTTNLDRFIAAKLRHMAGRTVTAGDLYAAYREWAQQQDIPLMTAKAFGLQMNSAGIKRRRGTRGLRLYEDVELR